MTVRMLTINDRTITKNI